MAFDIIERNVESAIPDNAVYANTGAWHNTGTVLDTNGERGLTLEQALPESGLDFTVVKVPIYGPDGQDIDRRWGVMREDTKKILGVVGDTWEPMQTIEGFAILDDIVKQAGGDRAWIETAGTLDESRKVWMLVRIDAGLQIAGEDYRSYLLFYTGFDGRASTTCAAVDERVVCANTLNYAIFGEAKATGYVVRVRHTRTASDRMRQAAHLLGMRNQRAEELAKQGEWLVEQTWDDGEVNNLIESILVITEDQEDKPAGTMIANEQDKIRSVYFDSPTIDPIRGTAWGAFQAVLEYADHKRNYTNTDTQTRAQLGMSDVKIKQTAYDMTMALSVA